MATWGTMMEFMRYEVVGRTNALKLFYTRIVRQHHLCFGTQITYCTKFQEQTVLNLIWSRFDMSLVLRKPDICICKNKAADHLCGYSGFVFAIWKEQSFYFLNPKFRASSHPLWLHNLVCVGPGRNPRRPVFSERGSYIRIQCRLKRLWNTSRDAAKPVFGVSDQVGHKPGCTTTEDS